MKKPEGDETVGPLSGPLYQELQRLARNQLRGERPGHTLDTGSLVHESFERLHKQPGVEFNDRNHFLSVAAMVMRRVLVDHARSRARKKRGAAPHRMTFDENAFGAPTDMDDLLLLDQLIDKLSELNERHGRVVVLRFFGGLTFEEIAATMNVSVPTARRDWRVARAWLAKELADPA